MKQENPVVVESGRTINPYSEVMVTNFESKEKGSIFRISDLDLKISGDRDAMFKFELIEL